MGWYGLVWVGLPYMMLAVSGIVLYIYRFVLHGSGSTARQGTARHSAVKSGSIDRDLSLCKKNQISWVGSLWTDMGNGLKWEIA